MMMSRTMKAALFAVLAGALPACAARAPEQTTTQARLPDPGFDGKYQLEWPDLGRGAARYVGITIGDDMGDVCHLPKTQFEFDSTEPLPQERAELGALADCLRSGPLAGARVTLIGRADPRGTPEYNRELALLRADRVKEILVKEGIAADRISTRSTGDAEAVGAQPMYSYGYDRRVDVVLLGVTHAPR